MSLRRATRRLVTALHAAFPALTRRWVAAHPLERAEDVPWTPARVPLGRARLGLVTTAGLHLADQAPFDMEDPDGDPSWRVLPADAADGAWRITHDYYDARDARRDPDVVFPLRRARELVAAGRLGGLTARHAGLMGHVDGPRQATLDAVTAPEVAALFRDERADIVLLAPA